MADNTDSLPLFIPQLPAQFMQDKVIVGNGNIVGSTAQNVIVNGIGNYVGDFCDNVNLFNCSGCIVEPYTSGVIMLASSGIVANQSDTTVISNVTISGYSFINDANSHKIVSANYTIKGSDKIIIAASPGITINVPSFDDFDYPVLLDEDLNNVLGGKVFTIKNMAFGDIYVATTSINNFEADEITSPMTLQNTDSVTLLISNVSGNTILII